MANKHMKRYSTLLIIRKMQIKTIMRYYFTPIRIAIIQKAENNTLARMWRNRNPCALLVGIYNNTGTMEDIIAVPQKINIDLPYNPAIPLLGIYPK